MGDLETDYFQLLFVNLRTGKAEWREGNLKDKIKRRVLLPSPPPPVPPPPAVSPPMLELIKEVYKEEGVSKSSSSAGMDGNGGDDGSPSPEQAALPPPPAPVSPVSDNSSVNSVKAEVGHVTAAPTPDEEPNDQEDDDNASVDSNKAEAESNCNSVRGTVGGPRIVLSSVSGNGNGKAGEERSSTNDDRWRELILRSPGGTLLPQEEAADLTALAILEDGPRGNWISEAGSGWEFDLGLKIVAAQKRAREEDEGVPLYIDVFTGRGSWEEEEGSASKRAKLEEEEEDNS